MEVSTLPPEGATLLIVDDDPMMTDLFRQYMSRQGFRVITATSAEAALDTVRSGDPPIDVLVTDMTMPDMDGATLAQELARLRPELPVLIATGHDPEESQAGLPGNVMEVVKKPYPNKLMAERIRAILAKHRRE